MKKTGDKSSERVDKPTEMLHCISLIMEHQKAVASNISNTSIEGCVCCVLKEKEKRRRDNEIRTADSTSPAISVSIDVSQVNDRQRQVSDPHLREDIEHIDRGVCLTDSIVSTYRQSSVLVREASADTVV